MSERDLVRERERDLVIDRPFQRERDLVRKTLSEKEFVRKREKPCWRELCQRETLLKRDLARESLCL